MTFHFMLTALLLGLIAGMVARVLYIVAGPMRRWKCPQCAGRGTLGEKMLKLRCTLCGGAKEVWR